MNATVSGVMIGATRMLAVLMRPFATADAARVERVMRTRLLVDRVQRHAEQARVYGLVVFREERWLWADDVAALTLAADESAATDPVTAGRLRSAAAAVQTWGENAARGVKGSEQSRSRAADALDAAISTLRSVRRGA